MNNRLSGFLAATALVASFASAPSRADGESWEVRLRVVYLDPANKSDAIPGLAPENAVHINSKVLPDSDLKYYSTPHVSSELVPTYPQSQTVTVNGTPIGTFKHLGYRF